MDNDDLTCLLFQAETEGVIFSLDGNAVRLEAAAPPSPGLVEEIRQHKPALVALLRGRASNDPGPVVEPPHPAGEQLLQVAGGDDPVQEANERWARDNLKEAVTRFVSENGQALTAAGWGWLALFGTTTPWAGPIHTLSPAAALIGCGATLVEIQPDRITLRRDDGRCVHVSRGGVCRLESLEEALARLPPELLESWHERAAVRQFDAGFPREQAEQLALVDIMKESAR